MIISRIPAPTAGLQLNHNAMTQDFEGQKQTEQFTTIILSATGVMDTANCLLGYETGLKMLRRFSLFWLGFFSKIYGPLCGLG